MLHKKCGPHWWRGKQAHSWHGKWPHIWRGNVDPTTDVAVWGQCWRGIVGPRADVALWTPPLTWQCGPKCWRGKCGSQYWRGSVGSADDVALCPLVMWHCGSHCWPCKFHPLIPNSVMCCIYKHLVFHYPSNAIYFCCCIRMDKCCIRGQRQRPQTQHTKSVGYLDFWSKATPYGV